MEDLGPRDESVPGVRLSQFSQSLRGRLDLVDVPPPSPPSDLRDLKDDTYWFAHDLPEHNASTALLAPPPGADGDDSISPLLPVERPRRGDGGRGDPETADAPWQGAGESDPKPANIAGPSMTSDPNPCAVRPRKSKKYLGISLEKFWAYTGPGWLMSIAYLDPGNLESDLQTGAIGGYGLIWVLFYATIIGGLIQILSARLGVVSGAHMAELVRLSYPRWAVYTLYVLTQIAIIGSDVQEVVGSAIAFNVLFGFPLWFGVLFTAIDSLTFLSLERFGFRKLELLFALLIGVMSLCFGIEFIIGRPDLVDIFIGSTVPVLPSYAVVQAVGMVGAIIMPHNLYLHSALVQTRRIPRTHAAIREACFYFSVEAWLSLFVSFCINCAIVSVFAKGFFDSSDAAVHSGDTDIGLADAGDALYSTFGPISRYVWGIGLLAAGQSSTMTGTMAGQYVMEGMLQLRMRPIVQLVVTRAVSMVPAVIVGLLYASRLDALNEWLNVLQSIQLPFAVLPLIHFSASRYILGRYRLSASKAYVFLVLSTLLMSVNVYLVYVFVWDPSGFLRVGIVNSLYVDGYFSQNMGSVSSAWALLCVMFIVIILYVWFCIWLYGKIIRAIHGVELPEDIGGCDESSKGLLEGSSGATYGAVDSVENRNAHR